MKTFGFFFVLVIGLSFMDTPARAQAESKSKQAKNHRKKIQHFSDSAWKKDFKITDSSEALIINRIEDINNILNAFNDVIERGYDTSDIADELPRYERNINIFKYNISSLSGSLNLRNLSLLQDILEDMINDLKDWQSALLSYYTELVSISTRMAAIKAVSVDSTLQKLPPDGALRSLYTHRMKELETKWRSTDTVIRETLLKIDRLQTKVSSQYNEAIQLQNNINGLIKSYSKKAFGNEYGYLWQAPAVDSNRKDLGQVLERSVSVTGKVLEYYLNDNWGGRITAFILTIFFFFWVYLNLRKIRQNNLAVLEKLKYIHALPITASLVFLFTVIPFLDLHPPAVFVEMMQLLLVASLTGLLFKRWPRKLFNFWLILVALLLFHSIKGLMISSTYSSRIITFIIDILSIGLGVILVKEIKKNRDYFPRYMVVVAILYIVLNGLAVLCNLFGRVTLAQVFGNTAISNLVQAIGLIIFIQIFIEAVYLQLEADKKSTRFTAYLNYQNVELRLRRILTFIAGIFWFINLTQNLNVYESAYNDIVDFLNTVRTVGNTSFTWGSIAIFFFIIWISHILQKYIGYFFGDTEDEIMPDKKTKLGTSVLLIRLVILTAGFFLGILASGIPLDRVTIIIGALGVGIGLGLQNIVNNLVSGVILAIERPIQVGDIIEIGSNSGRVKEIGIRSSRIVTPDGAEVIIPNGDMLSQKLTNWTLSNSYLRGEIILKLANGTDIDKARKLIFELIAGNEEIMQKPEPQVLVRNVGQSGTELQILFWAYDINKWVQLKSDMLQKIYQAFTKESITLV